MPNTLQIKRGLQINLPTGLAGELLYTSDTKRVYIGDGATNNLLQGASSILTTGMVSFSDSSGKLTGSSSLYWDNTNGRLGIGTASPTNRLDLRISSASATNNILKLGNTQGNAGVGTGIVFYADTTPTQGLFNTGRIYSDFPSFAYTSARMIFQTPTGQDTWNDTMCLRNNNVLINTTTDAGFKLDVNGTARVSGQTSIAPPSVTGALTTPSFDIEQTWNTTGAPTAIKLNITDTASNGNSRLLDIQVGGVSKLIFGKNGKLFFGAFNSTSNIQGNDTSKGLIFATSLNSVIGHGFEFGNLQGSITNLSSTSNGLLIQAAGSLGFSPTSGTGIYNSINISDRINQTGTANGITRGLFISPILTAVADFRAIEVANGITILGASTTAKASLRIPSGTAPTSPVNGDIWFDGTNIQMRIGGITRTFTLI